MYIIELVWIFVQ